MSKTDEKINEVKMYLLENYRNKIISYSIIAKEFALIGHNPMSFYRFVYAGVLDIVSPAHYKINNRFETTSAYRIRVLSNDVITEKRKVREAKKRNYTAITSKGITQTQKPKTTEHDAISLLKALGYKIMKPVNQYEEV